MAEQKAKSVSSKSIHSKRAQKSSVMNRKFVKPPVKPPKKISDTKTPAEPSKKDNATTPPKQSPRIITATPVRSERISRTTAKTTKEIKDKAIKKSLADLAKRETTDKEAQTIKQATKAKRILFIMIATTACLAIIGTVAYFSIPKISYTVHALQAPFDPTFPTFLPDGYSLNASSLDENNQLTTVFINRNNSEEQFSLTQEQSSWTSTNLDNSLKESWGNTYSSLEQFGLKIFFITEKGTLRARWVSGGVLYSLNSGTRSIDIRLVAEIAISAKK